MIFIIYFFLPLCLQREELRARFPGVPGDLVNFFLYVAEEVIRLPTLFIFMVFSFSSLLCLYISPVLLP